jgi:predicted CXXCH cytochrome family protein
VAESDHNLSVTAPAEKNLMGETPEQSGPCGACHVPHNAAGRRLWAKPLAGKRDYITQLCTSCHIKDGAAQNKIISRNSHPVDVPIERIRPGKNVLEQFPTYSHDGNKQQSARVVCTTCHEPHTWSPESGQPQEESWKSVNREGDVQNSFLRKANYPPSALCKTCHVEQTAVEGTPHDLNITAPDEKNLLGQTVKESGQCGVCHMVHNSPNRLKLWARQYGPVKKNENKMIGLCTSCHSEGNVAEKKVQKIATHPDGIITTSQEGFISLVYDDSQLTGSDFVTSPQQRYTPILISNVIGFASGRNYTPIFNDRGAKVNTGKISCPSCHNVHKWSLNQDNSKDSEYHGEKKGAKFLRTESYNLVCVDCHGQDAMYRYLYFHSPRSRSWGAKHKRAPSGFK